MRLHVLILFLTNSSESFVSLNACPDDACNNFAEAILGAVFDMNDRKKGITL